MWFCKSGNNAAAAADQPEALLVLTSADCQSPGAQCPIAVPEGRTNPKSIPRLKTVGETRDRSCNVYRRRYAHATQAFSLLDTGRNLLNITASNFYTAN